MYRLSGVTQGVNQTRGTLGKPFRDVYGESSGSLPEISLIVVMVTARVKLRQASLARIEKAPLVWFPPCVTNITGHDRGLWSGGQRWSLTGHDQGCKLQISVPPLDGFIRNFA